MKHAMLLALIAPLVVVGQASAISPSSVTQNMLPAFVQSMTFNNGLTMSSSTSVSWGAWEVRFSSTDRPVAKYLGGGNTFSVSNLLCKNAVTGTQSCWAMFFVFPEEGGCIRLDINAGAREDNPRGQTILFNVRCPESIELGQ